MKPGGARRAAGCRQNWRCRGPGGPPPLPPRGLGLQPRRTQKPLECSLRPGDPDQDVKRPPEARAGDSGPGRSGRPAPQSSPDGRPGPQEALEGPVGRAHGLLGPGAQHRGRAEGPPPPPAPPLPPLTDRGLPGLLRRRNPRLKSQLFRGRDTEGPAPERTGNSRPRRGKVDGPHPVFIFFHPLVAMGPGVRY